MQGQRSFAWGSGSSVKRPVVPGGARRREASVGQSPQWSFGCSVCAVDALLSDSDVGIGGLFENPLTAVEPCVGEGHLVRAVNDYAAELPEWIMADVSADVSMPLGSRLLCGRELLSRHTADVVITYPARATLFPFFKAAVESMPTMAAALLGRTAFANQARSAAWMKRHGISMHPIPWKIPFVHSEGCYVADHAWFIWWSEQYSDRRGRFWPLTQRQAKALF